MKKVYIAPSIKVRKMDTESILAASVDATGGKVNFFGSDDEEHQIQDGAAVGAKRHIIDWGDEEENE